MVYSIGMDNQQVKSYRLVVNEYDYPKWAERVRDHRYWSRDHALDCVPRGTNWTSYSVEPSSDEPNIPEYRDGRLING